MDTVQWGDITPGSVIQIGPGVTRHIPGIDAPYFVGMVVEKTDAMLELASIAISPQGEPYDMRVNVERHILEEAGELPSHHPEYRAWCEPESLLGFELPQPEVPQGLTLEELVRYNNGVFVLSHQSAGPRARFRQPFFDHTTASIVRQEVVVFALSGVDTMDRENVGGLVPDYEYSVPTHASFVVADRGPVLLGINGQLALGRSFGPGGGLRWHDLTRRFAIEAKVLKRAGIVLPPWAPTFAETP